MSNTLNFYGDKSTNIKIEYVVNSYNKKLDDKEGLSYLLDNMSVPFNAAVLISHPDFEDIQTINNHKIDCHNTVWVKYKEKDEIKYRLYANLNVNSVTLQGCNASTYNLSYTDLLGGN